MVLPYYLSHGHVQLPPSYEDLHHKHNKFTNNYWVNNLIQDFFVFVLSIKIKEKILIYVYNWCKYYTPIMIACSHAH